MNPITSDRYNMQDTPESADERESVRQAAYEREVERADYLRDEMRDREIENHENHPQA